MTIIVGFLLATIATWVVRADQTRGHAAAESGGGSAKARCVGDEARNGSSGSAETCDANGETGGNASKAWRASCGHPRLQRQSPLPRLRRQNPRQRLQRNPRRQFARSRKKSREQVPKPPSQAVRRDPFESLVARQEAAAKGGQNLPPGKAGLQVGTLRVDGIVKANSGMIAVVTNPQARTYFLREGDRLYDGAVEKISMDGVTFHEEGKDAFGKAGRAPASTNGIYSMAGEPQ